MFSQLDTYHRRLTTFGEAYIVYHDVESECDARKFLPLLFRVFYPAEGMGHHKYETSVASRSAALFTNRNLTSRNSMHYPRRGDVLETGSRQP